MSKKFVRISYIIALFALGISALVRTAIRIFTKEWSFQNLDNNHTLKVVSSGNGPISVLLTKIGKKNSGINEGKDQTHLFLKLTWVNIISNIVTAISAVIVVLYGIYNIYNNIKESEEW